MLNQIKAKLTFLVLILVSCFAQAQDFVQLAIRDSVHVESKIEKHLWLDSNTELIPILILENYHIGN